MKEASCLSILRLASLADSEQSLSLLTARLLDHFETTKTEESALAISNKYFSATVALRTIHTDQDGGVALKEDGIVLVVENSQDNLNALNLVHDQAVEAGGGDLLRLCVMIDDGSTRDTAKTPKEIEEEYSKRVLWCLDRGYEYVPMCDLSEEGVSRGHDERDKEGFARLVEAIQGTVWSSAVMASKTKKQTKPLLTESPRDDEEPEANAYEPPDPSKLTRLSTGIAISSETDDRREEKARQTLLMQASEEEGEYLSDEKVAASLQQKREELANERLFDQFEGAIREASRIRDQSRAGDLSDEDRRKRAGDAAAILMDLMGKMGFDDDEDDEVENDDSSCEG